MKTPVSSEEKNPWVDSFKFEGKTYRIFKREPSKDAVWYVHFQKFGKRYLRSLDTNIKETAVGNAKIIIGAVKESKWAVVDALKGRRDVAALGEVFDVYERVAEVKERTATNNISALAIMVRTALGDDGLDVRRQSCGILTADLVRRFRAGWIDDELEDEEEISAKRTANSYIGQARSVFARHVLPDYESAGLKLPDLREFMDAPKFRKVGKIEYNAPSDDLISKTFAELEMLKDEDRAVYLAICLAVGAGLRKGEIYQARWNWFVQRGGRAFVRGDKLTKNNQKLDGIIMSDWWARIVKCSPGAGTEVGDAFVLEGTKHERQDEVFRRVGLWMRGLGWETQKTTHEFRAYVGSQVCSKYGLEAASAFLRHADLRTTKNFYMRYLKTQDIDVSFVAQAAG